MRPTRGGFRWGVALGASFLGLGMLSEVGGAGPTDPIPERIARPVPPVAWSAFLSELSDSLPELPMRGAIHPSRWAALERALGKREGPPESPAPQPVAASSPGEPGGADISGSVATSSEESPGFFAKWTEALARAREDDARGCWRALLSAAPRTLEGARAARRLAFFAAVSLGDRPRADSLFYRMEGSAVPGAASRLETWKYLESGQGQAALRALEAVSDPTPGERAARAMAAWQAGSFSEARPPDDWTEVEGLPRVALALVAAAHSPEPASILDRVPRSDLPEAWTPVYEALRPSPDRETAEGGDAALYRKGADAFASRRDAEALPLLDDLLAGWPSSSLRSEALLLRAHLHLAAGRRDDANSDLRALERQAVSSEMEVRTAVLRAFWEAQNGFYPEAETALADALSRDFGARAEAEIRFDRVRLSRMAGDRAAAEAGILELEEAFPKEPWAARARSDNNPERWKEPWRSLPAVPASTSSSVAVPTEGPWGLLLWGERVLSREADALAGETSFSAAPVSGVPVSEPASQPGAASTPGVPNGRLGYLEAGVGAPAFGSLGAGLGGARSGFLYRAEAGQLLAQERNRLPEYRRTDWEIAGAKLSSSMRYGVALEGTGRTDDDAPGLGLNPDPVDTYAWGVRADLSLGNPKNGIEGSISRMAGDVDAGISGRWKSTETWFEARGAVPMGRSRWEARWASAHFNEEDSEAAETTWLQDLRVVVARPSGWYLGGRAAMYRDRGLVLPVIGIEKKMQGWQVWVRGEPSLLLPNFREVFVANGDWNVPSLGLQAERRTLDVEAGVRAGSEETQQLTVEGKTYEVDELRTWQKSGGLWVEHAMNDATGLEFLVSGTKALGDFRLSASGHLQKLRAEDRQVPYVPVVEGRLELSYEIQAWRAATRLLGVDGREDDFENAYGSFLRWDLEGALKLASPGFLPSDRIEVALRLENVTDAQDRRWPGVPGYGRGIFLGVRTLYGQPSGR